MWFRRDLRLLDNPALNAAGEHGDGSVLPVFILDPRLWSKAGAIRQHMLLQSLSALNESLQGKLLVRMGEPARILKDLARLTQSRSVHIAADFGPFGRRRDALVESALDEVALVRTGSPYAVSPGRIRKADGSPYRVFTPFLRAWSAHGWPSPAPQADMRWLGAGPSDAPPDPTKLPAGTELPAAGEPAAWERWELFHANALRDYPQRRDHPDVDGTSAMSHHLRWGAIHPRSLLHELGEDDHVLRMELCWREFYADVLLHHPQSATQSLDARFDQLPWARGTQADQAFARWSAGTTGFPLVDAGMRQLLAEGWMHNRVRMVVASFLVKDLHLPWQRGAQYFMQWLRDGDLASNAHGWQWVAGSGTDAAPFHRIFNPVTQGLRFDPAGEYVRRHVPELRHLDGPLAHEPWKSPVGFARGYPERVVDHALERRIALENHGLMRSL